MAPQTRASSFQLLTPPETASKVNMKMTEQGIITPDCHTLLFWEFPGFMFPRNTNPQVFLGPMLSSTFTDAAVLASLGKRMGNEKKRIKAVNNLAVLFKALLFHRKFFQTYGADVATFLGKTFFFFGKKITRVRDAYVAARRAYVAQQTPSDFPPQSILTDLVDEWIKVLDSYDPTTSSIVDEETETEFALVQNSWTELVRSGRLMNAGQVRTEPLYFTPPTTGRSTSSNPNTDSSIAASSVLLKRKASALVSETPKRVMLAETSDDEASITQSMNSDSDVEDAALAQVRELAEKRHTAYTTKLQKMKARYAAQKKRVGLLEHQLKDVLNTQLTHSSLSPSVKSNTKSVKWMIQEFEHHKEALRVLQKLVKKMEERLEESGASQPQAKMDDVYQEMTDKLAKRVKHEVRTTWTGAAMELSNTKREFSDRANAIDQCIGALGDQISQQQAVAELHEKSLLEQKNSNDGHDQRLVLVESQLATQATQGQDHVKLEDDMAHYPHTRGSRRERIEASESQELRDIIASQGNALRVQGKQMEEMAREMESLKETVKDVPDLKDEMGYLKDIPEEVSCLRLASTNISEKVSKLDGMAKLISYLDEMRRTMANVFGRQAFGERSPTSSPTSSPASSPVVVNPDEVSKEITNYKKMRVALAAVLNRQDLEGPLAATPLGSRPSISPSRKFGSSARQQAMQSAVELQRDLEDVKRSIHDEVTASRVSKIMEKLESLKEAFSSPGKGL